MTPAYQIIAAGEDVSATFKGLLTALQITDEDGRSGDKLTLDIDNPDGKVAIPETDVQIEVALGYKESGLISMGRFAVDEVSGGGMPRRMTIGCTAANMTSGLRAPRSRGWTDVTLEQIVVTIASEAGLTPVVGASLAATHYPFIAQSAESDLNLLMRLARPLDATAKPAGGHLIVQRRDEGVTATGEAIAPATLKVDDTTGWTWKINPRRNYASVTAEWGDWTGGTVQTVTAGAGTPTLKLRHVFATEGEATRAAQAELAMAARDQLQIMVECQKFRPDLFAGRAVDVAGLEPGIDGRFLINKVTHSLTGALRSSFEARKAKE